MDGAANDELFISPSENTTTMTNDQAKWVLNLIFVKNVNRFGPSLPKSHKLGKIKTGSRPDIGQFITKEQGTVAFCKTDETRFR